LEKVLLAYEPAWAIGTGSKAADPLYASWIHGIIRKAVTDQFGSAGADGVAIIYGGSVDQENALGFLMQPEVDGLFIGRAAYEVERFVEILNSLILYMDGKSLNF